VVIYQPPPGQAPGIAQQAQGAGRAASLGCWGGFIAGALGIVGVLAGLVLSAVVFFAILFAACAPR
jgi:hypothetical protein